MINLDAKRYSELKAEGIVTISKVGNDHILTVKKYSQNTGVETLPEMTRLDIRDLQGRKVSLQQEIDAIDVMIADCQALDA